mmetsp:Transcript_122013/g.304482  ORF Transcript_122013/g.304482 Transcript_122013/m.304482 type:complete len:542 (+) Transcript_122013:3675-5300(+)
MTFLAWRRSPTEATNFLYLATSPCAVLIRVLYLMSSAPTSAEASLPFASICLTWMYFLASESFAVATTSAFAVSSAAFLMSSEESSANLASSSKQPATSVMAFVAASASATCISASLIRAFFFLMAVFVFRSVSRFVCVSSTFCSSFSFAVASWDDLGEKRLASMSFVAMNILAMETAVFAEVAAVSQAFTATRVSSKGSSSTPMRKGPSALAALETVSCTVAIFSVASLISTSQLTRSAASLCEALSCTRRRSAFLALSSNPLISDSTRPVALCFLIKIKRRTADTSVLAFCTAASACDIISFVLPSPARSRVASSALSHSTSAGVSFSITSATICCAVWRCSKSWRTVFRGLSLFCASWSCIWSFVRPWTDCSFTFADSKLRAMPCLVFKKIRASPIAICAALVAASVSPTAFLTSSRLSPPAWIISEVITAFSTRSSAVFAFSWHSGSIAWKTFVSFSSAALAFSSCSAFTLAPRSFVSSWPTCAWRFLTAVPSCKNCLDASPTDVRWASMTFFRASLRAAGCGVNISSAAFNPAALW